VPSQLPASSPSQMVRVPDKPAASPALPKPAAWLSGRKGGVEGNGQRDDVIGRGRACPITVFGQEAQTCRNGMEQLIPREDGRY
jgi:hypothetical protein